MKPLFKVILTLGAVFITILILGRVFGVLTVENIRGLLEYAKKIDLFWVFIAVIVLLFIDIFVTVPTLTTTILAGFFLGFPLGALAAFVGMMSALFAGYGISRIWGEKGITLILKNETDRQEMTETFHKSGPLMIVFARGVPMLPEMTASMAGATKMRFTKYAFLAVVSTLPYALIGTYAGSVSSFDSPQPAIFAALFLYAVLLVGWYLFQRRTRSSR